MKELLKLSLTLGAVGTVAAAVRAYADTATKPARERKALEQRQQALQRVLPPFSNQPAQDVVAVGDAPREVKFYRARRDGEITAVAAETASSRGYGGNLNVLIGFKTDGSIRAVMVTDHSETPGLGTKATDRADKKTLWEALSGMGNGKTENKSNESEALPPNPYLDQYEKYTASKAPFKVKKDGGRIDAVSGATVSSRAVAHAVTKASMAFTKNKERILGKS